MNLNEKRKRGPKPKAPGDKIVSVWGTVPAKVVDFFGGKEAVSQAINNYLINYYKNNLQN